MYIYRLKLFKNDELLVLGKGDFSSPLKIEGDVLERKAIKALNQLEETKTFSVVDNYNNEIHYFLEVYEQRDEPAWQESPVTAIAITLIDSEFHVKAELH